VIKGDIHSQEPLTIEGQVIESEETAEAGRLFRLRRARERAEDAAGE
jgi:hypothetical protein